MTNAQRENADFMLEVLKVRHFFEFVVLGDDCEAGKPHPAPYHYFTFNLFVLNVLMTIQRYLRGLELAGVHPSECVTFEVCSYHLLIPSIP